MQSTKALTLPPLSPHHLSSSLLQQTSISIPMCPSTYPSLYLAIQSSIHPSFNHTSTSPSANHSVCLLNPLISKPFHPAVCQFMYCSIDPPTHHLSTVGSSISPSLIQQPIKVPTTEHSPICPSNRSLIWFSIHRNTFTHQQKQVLWSFQKSEKRHVLPSKPSQM